MGLGPFGACAVLIIISAVIVGFLVLACYYGTAKKEKKIFLDSFRSVLMQLPVEQLRRIALPYIHKDETAMRDELEEIQRAVIKEKQETAKK
jgi:hypothetical protein